MPPEEVEPTTAAPDVLIPDPPAAPPSEPEKTPEPPAPRAERTCWVCGNLTAEEFCPVDGNAEKKAEVIDG